DRRIAVSVDHNSVRNEFDDVMGECTVECLGRLDNGAVPAADDRPQYAQRLQVLAPAYHPVKIANLSPRRHDQANEAIAVDQRGAGSGDALETGAVQN